MADTKISALPASTTPLAGTEVLPIVQSGATKQVSVANLTAGRALSATELTLTTGNLVIGTAGKGIDFSADPSAAGMTSELLDDYEEGTWDPVYAPTSGAFGTVTYAFKNATYTKIGNTVRVNVAMRTTAFDVGTGTGNVVISGLPFTAGSTGNAAAAVGFSSGFNVEHPTSGFIAGSATTIGLYTRGAANANSAAVPVSALQNGANLNYIILSAVYNV